MSVIEDVRRRREKLALVLKDEEYSGIRQVVEDLYPDKTHFIYELLQNAEDVGAKEAHFLLTPGRLIFEHNGRPFTRQDLEGITNIGKGSKAADRDKIGRFGIGFKAVFVYCDTPHIWSPTLSFKITDLVLPSPLAPEPDLGACTRFAFPFDNPKKPAEAAYSEVSAGLDELAETTLLFLSDLESIRWQIEGGLSGEVRRMQHSAHHFEVVRKVAGETTVSSHFLRFSRPIEGLAKQYVAAAFALDFLPNVRQFDVAIPLAKQVRIVSATPGRVAVSFPAEKENSGLRFHLHAPFVPELSRASVKETPANQPLFLQLAALTAASLHEIRDLGLLTTELLAVLPNPQDPIPPRYQGVREAIVKEMNTQPLTPTHSKSHAPAEQLLQAKASVKELLSQDDLKSLVPRGKPAARWAIAAAQKNSNADRFLAGLAIAEWDVEELAKLLSEKTTDRMRQTSSSPPSWVTGPDERFMTWLSGKPVEWHQRLYSLLYTEFGPQSSCRRFRDLKIVRLSDGTYGAGSKCFFPGGGIESDDVLPRVDESVYTFGKSKPQQENAKKFLVEIGVRPVGEAEQIEAILKRRYTKEAEIPDEKTYRKDLKRFVSLVDQEPARAGLFASYYIFEGKDGKWGQPSYVFLDEPFLDTGLSAYHDLFGDKATRVALAHSYQECGVPLKRLVKFAEAVGAQTRIELSQTTCYSNPQWAHLSSVGGDRHTSPINRDYCIGGLETVLATPSLAISRLLWRTMVNLPQQPNYLQATYQRNQSWGARHADSQLIHHLRTAAWIPQGQGVFVKPADASRDLLPEGFAFDPGWPWLKAIHFGQELAKKSEAQRQKQELARELGFADNESLDRAKRFAALPPSEQERILIEREQNVAAELPDQEPSNPERRAQRVGTGAAEAPERRSEERTRSVSVGRDEVKQQAGQYLSQQYTNADGEMICQVCKAPVPFKLDDGTAYFERVEFLPELKKRHYQNYLALCPNHAAMFQHANGSTADIQDTFVILIGNELEIVLAQSATAIYFTKTHIADLKEVIRVDRAESEEALKETTAGRA